MMLIVSYALMILGLLMSLIGLPGIWAIFAGIVISAFSVGFPVLPVWVLVVYFLVALVTGLVDNIAIAVGAKGMGASKWGVIGAILGGLIGFLLGNLLGLIIGPFIGAVLLEITVANKDVDSAIKAGIGTFLGYIVSIFIKFTISLVVVGSWLYLILGRN